MKELVKSNQLGSCHGWCACVGTTYLMIFERLKLKKKKKEWLKSVFWWYLMFYIECSTEKEVLLVKDITEEAISSYLHLWFGYTFNRCFSEDFLIVTRSLCVYWVLMQTPIVTIYWVCYLYSCHGLDLNIDVFWFASSWMLLLHVQWEFYLLFKFLHCFSSLGNQFDTIFSL